MSGVRWLAEHHQGGVLHGRVGRDGDDIVAEWIAVATLRAKRDGSDVRFVPAPGADAATVEKIRQGSARVLVRQLRGELALHGAAVAMNGAAVALVGAADAGKSTLAATLCVRRGARLVADDAIALERTGASFELVPLETDHWLDAASRRALALPVEDDEKAPVRATDLPEGRVPLSAIIHLVFTTNEKESEAPRLSRLTGIEAVATLLPQVVRFVVDDAALQRAELEAIAALVGRVPIYRLERPRRLELLDATASLVADVHKVKP